MRKIVIATPSLVPFDAIGNDVLGQQFELTLRGFKVHIYAEHIHHCFRGKSISKSSLNRMLSSNKIILIYHHSIGWPLGYQIIENCRGYILLKYHNITPGSFFERYDSGVSKFLNLGRFQTKKIVELQKVHRYTADSRFNAQELRNLGVSYKSIDIIPPYFKLSEFRYVNSTLYDKVRRIDTLNVMFVGRIVPNKGHHHLVMAIRRYIEVYDKNIHLHLVGKLFPNKRFLNELQGVVNENRVGDHLTFHHDLSMSDLHTMYKASDLFLVASEHEGFCVPLLEAQLHEVPVIAVDTSAISETLGPDQVVLSHFDYNLMVAALNQLKNNHHYYQFLQERGLRNLKRFDKSHITNLTIESIDEAHKC